ncbi:MAG: Indole-3-pyruvate decarboxylase [Candidatus Celerinatantimonas neptuna]|nr:MAG: Indole-3-pyruvate decarboxylase [Candidatus Celerinatantimonas neptuna]
MKSIQTIGDHLINRLAEIGIEHIFGVPGDYNLAFLDHIINHPSVQWVGTANELNAAYAADGYARIKGAAAIVTTFGVGELSAINGIAGSYAEYLPVLHIVGAPSTTSQTKYAKMHHTLADGDFSHFTRMSAEVSAASCELTVENAPDEIDRVLRTMLTQHRPGYLVIPTNVACAPLPEKPQPFLFTPPACDPKQLDAFSKQAAQHLMQAKTRVLLTDFLAERWHCHSLIAQLLQTQALFSATTMGGKSIITETQSGFLGIYAGTASLPTVQQAVESADALITIGTFFFDLETSGFSHQLDISRMIDIRPFSARIGDTFYPDLPMKEALRCLIKIIHQLKLPPITPSVTRPHLATPEENNEPLTQISLLANIQNFIREDDLIIAEQGCSYFGAVNLKLPKNVKFIAQPLWASIGYSLPATLGAQLADTTRRTILLIGDGAAQMTAQSLGTILRHSLNPIILLTNNHGYTVERAIHGAQQTYNDIAQWNWPLLTQAMGPGKKIFSQQANTSHELKQALLQADQSKCLCIIDAHLSALDIPPLLATIAKAVEGKNTELH